MPATPLLVSPLAVLAFLAAIVAIVFQLEERGYLAPLFRRLPSVFWIYALPMLATSLGVLPEASPLYTAFARHLLPASLALLLLSADLRAIAALGPRALLAMTGASAGIAAGVVVAFALFGSALGPEAWKTLAALCGTWIGGSANLLAVGTALGLSPESQGIAILVDTLVGYSWMGVLIALAARQPALDRWFRVDTAPGKGRAEVDAIGERVRAKLERDRRPTTVGDATLLVGVALVVSVVSMAVGRLLPPVGTVLTPFAWGILVLTTAGLLLSLTPLSRYDGAGARSLGYAAFYLLLASVGAQADLAKIVSQPLWIAAGVVVILVHALVFFLVLRLLRAPAFFLGAASQACVGGYSSAPVVAEIYQPGLAPVGLLLAVVGNLIGTYVGLAVGQLLSGWAG